MFGPALIVAALPRSLLARLGQVDVLHKAGRKRAS